ncbi:hypothetical protein BBJ28_00008131 [Nothophytophthora sp. Chile5]|nr:hypothetical protein BBJ28_00008131 [Nothophytophthora sp. Chile5]
MNLEGKDVLAKTGNGKTIAFLLTVIKNMVRAGRRQGVIPTLNTGNIANRLEKSSVLILGESNRLLDMGFRPEIMRTIDFLSRNHQTLLFNATLTASTKKLKRVALRDNYAFVDPIDETEVDINIQTEHEYVVCELKDIAPCVLEMHSRKSQTQHTRWPKPPSRKGKKTVIFLSDASARGADYPDVLVVLQVGALARGDGAVGVADTALKSLERTMSSIVLPRGSLLWDLKVSVASLPSGLELEAMQTYSCCDLQAGDYIHFWQQSEPLEIRSDSTCAHALEKMAQMDATSALIVNWSAHDDTRQCLGLVTTDRFFL